MANNAHSKTPNLSDKPAPSPHEIGYGSDAIAEQLSRLDLKYIALVPGSSYRGLHDSLVNYKGNASPEMLICLHEEHGKPLHRLQFDIILNRARTEADHPVIAYQPSQSLMDTQKLPGGPWPQDCMRMLD